MMKFHCRLTAFLRSIYPLNLDQYSAAIPTLRRQKNNLTCPPFFHLTSIQFVACALRGNLSNRSSGVQIPRDICTRFGRYLHSTKYIWVIKYNTNFIVHSLWGLFKDNDKMLKKILIKLLTCKIYDIKN